VTPEVRLDPPRGRFQFVVPPAPLKVSLELKLMPFHHLLVAVSSMATETALMWVPAPEFEDAVPVIVFVQFVP
jgi:hypothetical protein